MISCRPTPTGYRLSFGSDDPEEPPFLLLDCEQVERTAWGMLSTVIVRAASPRSLPGDIVFIERINLVKGIELERVARRMGELLDGVSHEHHDWRRYLEQTAASIIHAESEPPPAVALDATMEPTQPRFTVVGMLVRDKPNVLYGAGGVGKSALSLRLAGSVLTGDTFFGHDVLDRGSTLYLDWEDDLDTIVYRSSMIARGMNQQALPLVYQCLRGRGSYERHHANVLRLLEDHPAVRLVVFDSTAMAMQGMPGDMAEQAIRFHSLVAEIRATVLLLDHVASDDIKHSPDGAAKPYGSVFKVNAARNVWEAVRLPGGDIRMRHRKNNVGPRMDDYDLSVRWQTDRVSYHLLSPYAPPWTPVDTDHEPTWTNAD